MTNLGAGESRWRDRQCLTTADVAGLLRVQPPTVHRMLRDGELIGFQVGPRGLWRVQVRDLDAFIRAATLRQERAERGGGGVEET